MSLYTETLNSIKLRKERVESGELNCIPFPLTHLKNIFPGLEQSSYLLVTGGSKSGKTQITNYLVLYNSIIYAYTHPETLRVKFLYFPLEESKEIVTLRFISYVLYVRYHIRISPLDLRSSNSDKPIPNNVLKIIENDDMKSIINFFDKCVNFYEGVNTSVGISITIDKYAEENGKIIYSDETFYDEDSGETKHYIDKYEPNDPEEYVFPYLDHANLLNPTKKEFNILNAITNMSKNMVRCKNRYKYIPVVIQQQVDSETNSLEAVKNNNILATKAGLKDCKSSGQDCTIMWGISNPGSFQSIDVWNFYDLNKFKRKYLRVFNIILNRFGEGDIVVPLYFDGAVNYYAPLPKATDNEKLEKFYDLIQKNS